MNLGIIGNGFIANVLLDTLKGFCDIIPKAILVREESLEKALILKEKYEIEKVYTDLELFLADKEIDTVYVGIINSLHYEYAKKSLLFNKNVICEKPFTKTKKEATELFALAASKNLYLFEAITTIHLPAYKKVKENLQKVGKVRIVNCAFSQYSSRYDNYLKGNIAPVFKKELFGGALVDLNIYNIHFAVSLFGKPLNVLYMPNIAENGVDTSGVLFLDYGDFKAVCIGAKDSASESFGIIQGEKGYIKIHSSLNECDGITVDTKEEKYHSLTSKEKDRMYYEFSEFQRIIKEKDERAYELLKKETLLVMDVLEKAYSFME